jgi:hypothetical protein
MYGLVNKAIEQMVCTAHGEDTWERVKERASVDAETFIGMEIYPDDLTYRLVSAASEVLGRSEEELFKELGRFWPTFTAHEGYKHLIEMAGSSLQELLENLDVLHACLVESFPKIKPPTFSYEQVTATDFDLHYHSQRKGLAPMVRGLIEALAQRFGTDVEVTHTQRRDDGDHDIFRIRVLDQVATTETGQASGQASGQAASQTSSLAEDANE